MDTVEVSVRGNGRRRVPISIVEMVVVNNHHKIS